MDKNYKEMFPNNTAETPRQLVVDFINGTILLGVDVHLQDRLYNLGYNENRVNSQNIYPEKVIENLVEIINGEALKEKPKIIDYVKKNVKDKDGKELEGEAFNKVVKQNIDIFKAKIYNEKKIEAVSILLNELKSSPIFQKIKNLMG